LLLSCNVEILQSWFVSAAVTGNHIVICRLWSSMSSFRSLLHILGGTDVKLQRLINYWAITAILYLMCVALL
jgi:hypothetical protein